MRVLHLSDIHLSSTNIEELRISYMKKFIDFLQNINFEKQVDLIIISGDIIDKSGISIMKMDEFKDQNPYHIFEKEFLEPITKTIPSLSGRIIFCAGNHDIESNNINEIIEAGLGKLLTSSEKVNEFIRQYSTDTSELNLQRLHKFLEFEKRVHEKSILIGDYIFSDFESTFLYNYNGEKLIGVAIINDSWRCSVKPVENNVIGSNQFIRALNYFEKKGTVFNIAILHHPLEKLINFEQKTIENLLHYQNFQIVFIGHEHNKRVHESNFGNGKKILEIRGRSAFDKPHEKDSDYHSGFSIIDIDLDKCSISCQFVKYFKNDMTFKPDLEDGDSSKKFYYGVNEETLKKIDIQKENFLINIAKDKFINNPEND